MRHLAFAYIFVLMTGALLFTGSAVAAHLSGIVVSQDEQQVPAALISLFDQSGNRKITVYSDLSGRFKLDAELTGDYKIRVRSANFTDLHKTISLAPNSRTSLKLILQPMQTKEEISDSLTASAHANKLKWHTKARQKTFISQCHYCHQQGNALTRQPRDEDEWAEIIKRMEGYFSVITPWDKKAFIKVLHEGFDGKPAVNRQTPIMSPQLAHAQVEEWQVGDGLSFIHDIEEGSDGHLYGVDQGHDVVWELDRKTGKTIKHQMPDSDLPQGGLYAGAQLPIGIFTGKHGPHSLVEDDKGTFWITGSLSSTLISFNIHTKKFKVYEIGGDALYPHTIRRDKHGILCLPSPLPIKWRASIPKPKNSR